MDMKRPQNHGQIATKGPCQLKSGTSASARTQSGPTAAAALQQPWKALSGEIGNGASVLWGSWQNRPSDSQMLSVKVLMSPDSCLFSGLEEH